MRTTNHSLAPVLDNVSADRLMEYTANIAQWVRLSGSDDERKAFQYIDKTLREWGLETEILEPLSLTSWPISATLDVAGTNYPCITHSFGTTTDEDGVIAEVVYAGNGTRDEILATNPVGKIILVEGPGSPIKAVAVEGTGAVGVIHISPGVQIKEMILSPVWGSPGAGNIDDLPTLPHVSVNGASGDAIKRAVADGSVTATMTTVVDTQWRKLPMLVSNIPAANGNDDFVLLSGHVDSWHYGAIDNGTADAAAMETVRVLNDLRAELTRGVRVAFWSGHSHARYATSAWYADECFVELHEHCVAHVNIDGPGAKHATILTDAPTMAETYDLARELIAEIDQQALTYHRIARMGDQSFWGAGLPSLYVNVSRVDANGTMEWYHTPLDTMEYIDPALLARDTKVLAATVYRLATDSRLPIDQSRAVDEMLAALDEIDSESGGTFDLSMVRSDLVRLRALTEQLMNEEGDARFNQLAMRLGRLLVPVNYSVNGPFFQDPALPVPTLPGLRGVVELSRVAADSPERSLLEVDLRRQRNRLQIAVRDAIDLLVSKLD